MTHDSYYIYVFIRQDISLAEQMVHVGHVCYHKGHDTDVLNGIPSLVVIGVPHFAAIDRVIKKLTANEIPHQSFHDPDTDYGITAVATEPLSPQQKTVLVNYRLWNHSPGAAKAVCGVTADGGAKAAVAQTGEHSVFNGEVVRVDTEPAAPIHQGEL